VDFKRPNDGLEILLVYPAEHNTKSPTSFFESIKDSEPEAVFSDVHIDHQASTEIHGHKFFYGIGEAEKLGHRRAIFCGYLASEGAPKELYVAAWMPVKRALPEADVLSFLRSARTLGGVIMQQQAATPDSIWVPLPAHGFVSGRAATRDDLKQGNAAFILEDNEKAIGTALPIEIPQYCYCKLKGEKLPAILIQAEEAKGLKLLGCRVQPSNEAMMFVISDVELLGKAMPVTYKSHNTSH
jgi:hypothetical protein